jgi:hypothetical protein
MKNFAVTLILAFVLVCLLSVNSFAEGNIGIGGRSCPPNTTCLVSTESPTEQADDATIIKTVIDYLSQLFG